MFPLQSAACEMKKSVSLMLDNTRIYASQVCSAVNPEKYDDAIIRIFFHIARYLHTPRNSLSWVAASITTTHEAIFCHGRLMNQSTTSDICTRPLFTIVEISDDLEAYKCILSATNPRFWSICRPPLRIPENVAHVLSGMATELRCTFCCKILLSPWNLRLDFTTLIPVFGIIAT